MDDSICDLRSFPIINKGIEATRKKIVDYVERMESVGKHPGSITLFAPDFDQCLRAVTRHRQRGAAKDQPKPPPFDGLRWGGTPVVRGRIKP